MIPRMREQRPEFLWWTGLTAHRKFRFVVEFIRLLKADSEIVFSENSRPECLLY